VHGGSGCVGCVVLISAWWQRVCWVCCIDKCTVAVSVLYSLLTAVTLKNGGNVLIPCCPSGVVYDLFECLSAHLDTVGLSLVPMYFISPVADNSLAYSNIYAEW
jgi:hypothetical protein